MSTNFRIIIWNICISVDLYVYLSILYIRLSIYLSNCLSEHLSYPFIYLYIHLIIHTFLFLNHIIYLYLSNNIFDLSIYVLLSIFLSIKLRNNFWIIMLEYFDFVFWYKYNITTRRKTFQVLLSNMIRIMSIYKRDSTLEEH